MTWWLVAIVPSLSTRKPVPPPSRPALLTLTVTTEGASSLKSSAGVRSFLSGVTGFALSTATGAADGIGAPASRGPADDAAATAELAEAEAEAEAEGEAIGAGSGRGISALNPARM